MNTQNNNIILIRITINCYRFWVDRFDCYSMKQFLPLYTKVNAIWHSIVSMASNVGNLISMYLSRCICCFCSLCAVNLDNYAQISVLWNHSTMDKYSSSPFEWDHPLILESRENDLFIFLSQYLLFEDCLLHDFQWLKLYPKNPKIIIKNYCLPTIL